MNSRSLIDTLDNTPFESLALLNVQTGFNVSIEFERGEWSPNVFGTSASEAILKAIRLHAPKRTEPPPPLPDITPVIAPPPY